MLLPARPISERAKARHFAQLLQPARNDKRRFGLIL